ncbi:hypothetical protein AVEN_137170-1 [Araneus ventricosus]|uniref:Uncharacterized protein n=1 Tax=Araneus ventricosus TaxID=182803 RepID=A0A4Y2P556_ARAVE|nr:hypothetical protein AVEN_137170-1 [Araneus ventricosus]
MNFDEKHWMVHVRISFSDYGYISTRYVQCKQHFRMANNIFKCNLPPERCIDNYRLFYGKKLPERSEDVYD